MKLYRLFKILFIFMLFFVETATAQIGSYVLIINSYNEGNQWAENIQDKIIKSIDKKKNISICIEYLNDCRFSSMKEVSHRADSLYRDYKFKPKAVVVIGEAGWIVYRSTLPQSWKNIPIVLSSAKRYTVSLDNLILRKEIDSKMLIPYKEAAKGFNVTGVFHPVYIKETMQLMKRLMPQMTKVAFISDKRYTSSYNRFLFKYIRKKYFPELGEISLCQKNIKTNDLLNSLSQMDKNTGLLYHGWYEDRNLAEGAPLNNRTEKMISSFTNSPVFGLTDFETDLGNFTGGYYSTCEDYGTKSGEILNRILEGKKASDIPFQLAAMPKAHLNYVHLIQAGLDKKLFPSNAVYYQKPIGFIEQNIILLVSVISLLLICFSILLSKIWFLKKEKNMNEEMKSFFTNVLDNIPVAVSVRDFGSNKFIYWNKKIEEITQIKSEDAIGKTNKELFSEEVYKRHQEMDNRLMRQGHSVSYEMDMMYSDGKLHSTNMTKTLIKSEGMPAYMLFTGWDVTELKAIQRKLLTSNNQLAMVMDAGDIISWVWDVKNRLVTFDYDYQKKSYFQHEMKSLTKSLDDILLQTHPDDVDHVVMTFLNFLEGKSDRICLDIKIDFYGNGYEWYELQGMVSDRDNDGAILFVTGSGINISKRKQEEQLLLEAKEKAEESNRLKSAFLANMSHEIRTPLNAIVGFSRILAEISGGETESQFASIIESNNDMLLQLINDILDLSKIEAGTLEFVYSDVDINMLFDEIEQSSAMKIDQSDVKIKFENKLPLCVIHTERNRLTQVVSNFISNSIKFTKQGSITFGYTLSDKKLRFYVKDTGCGIPNDKQSTVFDRFIKLNSFAQGTGLGLSICASIVNKLGGEIGVVSEEGTGSTFWFTIPYQPVEHNEKESPNEPARKSTLKHHEDKAVLLVAEDDDSNYKLIEAILGNEYKLIHAWNGEEAVRLYKDHQPDFVLTDIKMPVMDGYELTEKIRTFSKIVPIIAVTAYASEEDRSKINKSGFNGFVAKPINGALLKEKIRTLLKMD
ncbi:ABC transporter substrate binding protein [uncultured Bacteroides sp.]|uniref:ABC transporter substrate binding protein n=1 Tax=uncultured Bacteroides sp. TaxID=162156 RepID=UPI002AAA981A|nr:ABC transporter substrate binding protein [uncultured Bacteroides sp.]